MTRCLAAFTNCPPAGPPSAILWGLPARRPRLREPPDHLAAREVGVLARIVDAHPHLIDLDPDHHPPHPVAPANADGHLAAYPLALLGHRGLRFGGVLGPGMHHFGTGPGRDLVFPGAGVDIAARPPVDPIAMAAVAGEAAFVALPFPGAAAPLIDAIAVLAVGGELALIAIAVRPGLHPFAVLAT